MKVLKFPKILKSKTTVLNVCGLKFHDKIKYWTKSSLTNYRF